jgi:ATP-dependent Lon protease
MLFLKFLKILIKISHNTETPDKIDIMELKKNINESHYVISKRWILEKIAELS